MNQTKKSDPKLESREKVKEKLRKLKRDINLNKPGRIEAQLAGLASEFLRSGLSEDLAGAASLTEVLANIKKTNPKLPDEALDAATKLAYLIEEHWYGEDTQEQDQREAKKLAKILCDKLIPILDA